MKHLIICLIWIFLGSCLSHSQDKFKNKQNQNSNMDSSIIEIGYKDLMLIGGIEKKYQSGLTEDKINQCGCNNWELLNVDIEGILDKMKIVKQDIWASLCYYYPCYYTGTVKNDSSSYEITINAASSIILSNEHDTIYFIEEDKNKNFLIPCNCCE